MHRAQPGRDLPRPWKQVVDDDGHTLDRGARTAVCEKKPLSFIPSSPIRVNSFSFRHEKTCRPQRLEPSIALAT